MAAKHHNSFKVNLLIHKGEQIKLYVRLLKWVLSSGRYIVVFVELLVIGAFIFRYKLDAELIDIQEKIKDQIPYITSLKDDETLIKETQFQLANVKQVRIGGIDFAQALSKISQFTPQSVRLTSISLDPVPNSSKANFVISGASPSNRDLSAYLKALKNNPDFSGVALTNISFQDVTKFTITGTVNVERSKNS